MCAEEVHDVLDLVTVLNLINVAYDINTATNLLIRFSYLFNTATLYTELRGQFILLQFPMTGKCLKLKLHNKK